MDAKMTDNTQPRPSPLSNIDPMMIASSALVVGFAIGAGRGSWLGQTVMRLAESVVNLAMTTVSDELRKHNPEISRLQSAQTH